jgi:copper chaperone CopZ
MEMENRKFNTNIKCTGCVEKVTPHLKALLGDTRWEVDLNDPSRPLKISGPVEVKDVQEALAKAGYRADPA